MIDLITMKAEPIALQATGPPSPRRRENPRRDMRGAADGGPRDPVSMEMIAESDEKLMEAYFEAGELTPEFSWSSGLRSLDLAERKIFPVICAAAIKHDRRRRHAEPDRLEGVARSRDARPGHAARIRKTTPRSHARFRRSEPTSLFVFKTIADPFAGRLSLFRVCSGDGQGRLRRGQRAHGQSRAAGQRLADAGQARSSTSANCAPATSGSWPS